MLVPLSWLAEYVKITTPLDKLSDKLTEAGVGVEGIEKKGDDSILDLEITPNRPDLLSIVGVAREVAAIENVAVNLPKIKTSFGKPSKILPFTIKPNYKVNPRFTGIIVTGVRVDDSPKWLKDKLENIGQRPINNIVDITNFVMYELGNPLHAFDYDRIVGHEMTVTTAENGEMFESVDDIKYHLPKGAVVIRDKEKIIDLCGIKGGKNSGTYQDTKTVFIRVPVEVPALIRQTSTSIGLRSDASSIFEKAVDAGNTVYALKRAVDLILDIAGGEVASEIYDLKEKEFSPWKLEVNKKRVEQLIGIELKNEEIKDVLKRLNLSPVIRNEIVETTVPTYRNDLRIEEDIIEEIARLYGYNRIERKIPDGLIPTTKIPYYKDYRLEEKAKSILKSAGFTEIKSYSLISEADIKGLSIPSNSLLRADNPVSREYEYLRPTLKTGLVKGLVENAKTEKDINLFELGKTYLKTPEKDITEDYFLSGISSSLSFARVKGLVEKLFGEFGLKEDATKYIEILEHGIFFELNFSEIEKSANLSKRYKPVAKYPPIVEDMSFEFAVEAKTGEAIEEIKKQSSLVDSVSIVDEFKDSKTFRIVYQHESRNLTNEEVGEIRKKIEKALKEKFEAKIR